MNSSVDQRDYKTVKIGFLRINNLKTSYLPGVALFVSSKSLVQSVLFIKTSNRVKRSDTKNVRGECDYIVEWFIQMISIRIYKIHRERKRRGKAYLRCTQPTSLLIN